MGTSSRTGQAHPTAQQNSETVSDVLDSGDYSDSAITQWILRLWQGACGASQPHNKQAVMQVAAVRLFGDRVATRSSLHISDVSVLKRRYRQLALRVHPDKNSSPDAAEAFQVVQSCFEVAAAAGSAVTHWAWCPAPESREKAGNAGGTENGNERTASLCSSLFSSSSSYSSHHSVFDQSSSDQELKKERNASNGRAFASSSYAHFRTEPVRNAYVPEPPTVFFEAAAGTGEATPRSSSPAAKRGGRESTGVAPPPPPNIFGDEDEEEEAKDGAHKSDISSLPPHLTRSSSAHEAHRHPQRPKRHAEMPRDRSFSRNSGHRGSFSRDKKDTQAFATSHTRIQPRAEQPNVFASFSAVPPPPSVFTTTPSPMLQSSPARASSTQSGKASRSHRRRPELPTLAELLRRLDMEDGVDGEVDSDDKMTGTFRDRYTPSSFTGAAEFPTSAHFDEPATKRDAARLYGAAPTIHVQSKKHHTSGQRCYDGGQTETAIPTATHRRRDGASTRAPLTSVFAAASRTGGGDGFSDGGAVYPSSASPLLSRRVGGGATRGHVGHSAMGGGYGEEHRCACGKARQGQCFLCE